MKIIWRSPKKEVLSRGSGQTETLLVSETSLLQFRITVHPAKQGGSGRRETLWLRVANVEGFMDYSPLQLRLTALCSDLRASFFIKRDARLHEFRPVLHELFNQRCWASAGDTTMPWNGSSLDAIAIIPVASYHYHKCDYLCFLLRWSVTVIIDTVSILAAIITASYHSD